MSKLFPVHGEFSIQLNGDLVTVKCFGEWNVECARELSEKVKTLVQASSLKSYRCLSYLIDFLPTLEAMAEIKAITEWGIEHGLIREAIIIDGPTLGNQLVQDFGAAKTDIYEKRVFTSEQEALEWVNTQLNA